MMKQALILAAVVVAIIGGAVVFGKEDKVEGSPTQHVYGKADSSVKLVEFADFECPGCGFFFPIVQQLKENYKDKISFQFHNFPLVQTHRNALAAHKAAEAASKQGKFWEMHDLLFANQEEWNGPSSVDPTGVQTSTAITIFERYAEELQLDVEQFKNDVNDPTVSAAINADITLGKNEFQVTGTPTFVLNGQKIEDTTTISSYEGFAAVIDAALEESSQNTEESSTDDENNETAAEPQKPEEEQSSE